MTIVQHRALIGLGSNLDQPRQQLAAAMTALDAHPAIHLLATADLYETEPVGTTEQAWFLNTVVLADTTLSPEGLLDTLLTIEQRMGRVRNAELKNGPRRIDLDLLLYGDTRQENTHLTLPHPRMSQRAFVLLPLLALLNTPELSFLQLSRWVESHLGQSAQAAYSALGRHEAVHCLHERIEVACTGSSSTK